MEVQGANPNLGMRRNGMMKLEEYLDFIDSHNPRSLTINYLNQIIRMHGFKKIHQVQKSVVVDAVKTIDLMDPSRSTLQYDDVSSHAFLTLEEAKEDLATLNWQECCVTSLETINSVHYYDRSLNLNHLHGADASAASKNSKAKPKKRKRARKSERSVADTGFGGGFGASDLGSCSSSVIGAAAATATAGAFGGSGGG
ncbi:unnamed protein product [Ilex paraguariensis]|uniref:DUF7787 domain-containing protein n=1 Tax=Ilex paraguariensis TaxID=185542 RepID=A0ABC8QKW5_9AQUA